MNPERLSDRQLFALKHNPALNAVIREAVEQEFQRRNFSEEQLQRLRPGPEPDSGVVSDRPLSATQQAMLVLFPFFTLLHVVFAITHLIKGNQRRWKQQWRLMLVGMALWTLVVLLLARMHFAGGA